MKKDVSNQISLFELMDATLLVEPKPVFSHVIWTDKITEQEKLSQYLHQGERILSLLREKKPCAERYLPCEFMERFNISTYLEKKRLGLASDYIMKSAVKHARELWEQCDDADVTTNALLLYLTKYLYVDARTSDYNTKVDLEGLVKCIFHKAAVLPKGVVSVKSVSRNRDYEIPAGFKSVLPKNRHLREWRLHRSTAGYYLMADAGNLFWKALLVCVLKEQVQMAVKGLSENELLDNILYRYLLDKETSVIETYRKMKEFQHNEGGLQESTAISVASSFAEKPFVRSTIDRYPDVKFSEVESSNGISSVGLDLFIYPWFLSEDDGNRLPFELVSYVSTSLLGELLEKVCDVYETEKQTYEIVNELKKESAKVYQTKKNISLKCQREMISSGFNEYFGYVEIDDECDLERFKVVEQQFKALTTLLFHGRKNEDVSIRFRKLGRHHAAGLYFPSIKCLAVDVRNTDSLSHEYFHMLDYENKNVSGGYAFSKVRDRYKTCLMAILDNPENAAIKQSLKTKGKYNLGYYLTPTEVFARCGEIYLTKVRQVNNSLVKPDEQTGFAYPEDEELLELIKEYFDQFLETI